MAAPSLITRRRLLATGASAAGAAALAFGRPGLAAQEALSGLPARPSPLPKPRTHMLTLVAAEREAVVLGPGRPTSRVWSFADAEGAVIPTLRARVDDLLEVTLVNRLPKHTSIHWHGVRVPNSMDGVPYLTQAPVQPGERFVYRFSLPDPGTYFLHPHCDESGQVGRGLAAVLVVEGDAPDAYADADLVIAVKDWRLREDGDFLPLETKEGAGRSGTFGTVRGANGRAGPMQGTIPAGSDVRLRLLNLDGTRIVQLGIEGGEAAVIATDGHAIHPFPLDTWRLGPAMRVDLLVRAPARPGARLRVVDYGSAEPWTVAELTAVGSGRVRRRPFDPKPLFASGVPRVADPRAAERLVFTFGASSGASLAAEAVKDLPPGDPLAGILLDSLCVRDTSLWAINKVAWPSGQNAALPPPLGMLSAGRSYVFEWVNTTPHPHPIHLHGHTFEVLSASRQKLPRHLADTVILNPRERVEVAFVAAPGDWMLHCHILEHLEYGMMGYLRVAA
jgi:FtsP/CotA-like multicopper oxidase with cupredoxin domain